MAQTQDLLPAHEQDGPRPTPVAQPETTEPEAIKKLRELFAKGAPKASDVLAILDAHRSDRAAILAFLHANAGNGFVAQVMAEADKLRLSIPRRELVAGDPSDPTDGYFIASQKEKGARWRTADGDFTGTLNSQGLDSRLRTGDDTSLHLNVNKQKEATLGLEQDGEVLGQLAGAYRGSDNWNVGLRRPFALDDGATLTPELRHQVRPELGAADVAALGYRDPTTTAELYAGRHESGGFAGGLTGSHRFDDRTSASGYLNYSPDVQQLGLGGSHRYSDQLTLSGGLSHTERRHGDDVSAASLSARYRSPSFVGSTDLSYTHGSQSGDAFRGTASGDLQLAPNLYGGMFGDITAGPQPTAASLGASLTFTPSEKTALTAAGIIDDRGNLETRLEFDIFKRRIDSVGALADNRKKALISLFVSYNQGSRFGMLEDRYGAPHLGTDTPAGDGTVSAGIRFRF
jgi:hypothetical protein